MGEQAKIWLVEQLEETNFGRGGGSSFGGPAGGYLRWDGQDAGFR